MKNNNTSVIESSAPTNFQATVTKVKELLKVEQGCLNLAHKNKLEAMMAAFDIGEIIENEVLGPYGSGRMNGFAKLCGFQSDKSAYNYLNLYRAAGFKALLAEHSDLPRTYWYAIGSSIKGGGDLMGDMLRHSLLQFPIWKESDPDTPESSNNPEYKNVIDNEKLMDVGRALKDFRNELKQDGILYAFQEYELHIGKAPQGQEEVTEWWANHEEHLFYGQKPEDTYREVATFINAGMPSENEWVDLCYFLNYDKKDIAKYEAAREKLAKFHIAVSGITGWNHYKMDIGEKSEKLHEEFGIAPSAKDRTYKSIKNEMGRKTEIQEIRKQSPDIETVELKDKLIHGSCLELLNTEAIFKRMIDAVITDPPYGEEVYTEWREHTKVYHDEPKTTKEAADLLGAVAKTLVDREIIKEQFAWFSFCPIDEVHLFLPPVLNAFKGLEIIHQVLAWDKVGAGKIGGFRYFARQVEAIIYVNVGNRALSPITLEGDNKQSNKHSSLIRCRAESKAGENEFWKPLGVLEHLIKLATGEDDNEAANRQVILDPFCGSGSTGVAAINCHRDFRLIESHEGQFKKAKDNILEAAEKRLSRN